MDELVAFLRAALGRDEQVARAALADSSDEWFCPTETVVNMGPRPEEILTTAAIAWHIADWDPARVLAEVQAKRRILDAYDRAVQRQAENAAKFVRMTDGRYSNDPDYVAVKTHGWELKGRVDALRVAITELAQPYAGQPGWRDEWQLSAPA